MRESKLNSLYYIAFILLVILRFINISTLLNIPVIINYIILIISSLLFAIKILLDSHSLKEYILFLVLLLLSLYLYTKFNIYYFFTTLLSIYAIKNINIVKIVRIDVFLKVSLLLSNFIIYFSNYLFYNSSVIETVKYSIKGISHSLYFRNPNTVGALVLWLIIDIFYLISKKRKLKIYDYINGGILIIISYLVCKSRTPVYSYLIFVILLNIRSEKLIYLLSKYSYFILSILSLFIITSNFNNGIYSAFYTALNNAFSSRLGYSLMAYNTYGISLLPNLLSVNISNELIIDNFYVKCFVMYGIITLLSIGIINMFIPKKGYSKEKIIFIVSSIYLFFETVTISTGFSTALLLISYCIFNKKEFNQS